jgi:hypothetical protein
MRLPAFTAEASLYTSSERYRATAVIGHGSRSANALAPAAFFALNRVRRFLVPFFDPCSLCVGDCLRRGNNLFSCTNLCSFLCS